MHRDVKRSPVLYVANQLDPSRSLASSRSVALSVQSPHNEDTTTVELNCARRLLILPSLGASKLVRARRDGDNREIRHPSKNVDGVFRKVASVESHSLETAAFTYVCNARVRNSRVSQ